MRQVQFFGGTGGYGNGFIITAENTVKWRSLVCLKNESSVWRGSEKERCRPLATSEINECLPSEAMVTLIPIFFAALM